MKSASLRIVLSVMFLVFCLPAAGNAATGLQAGQAAEDKPVSASDVATSQVDFNRDIRPILSDTCYKCHGPDEENRAADLRLDTADGLAYAVEAGDLDASELIAADYQ